ncbi:MAG: hypothetical protein ABR552_07545, partial [Actinomycetota bacterium]
VLCDTNGIVVHDVTLATPFDGTTFISVMNDLILEGFDNSTAKYMVWFDGHPPGSPGGTGSLAQDDKGDPSNVNNFGTSYGVTWGYDINNRGPFIMMHENGHNLGAVQASAPHTSGAGHCNDGLDVMCYADGGPKSSYNANICAALQFDCGHDDYFNPNPVEGSYLSYKWNIGYPNSFLQGCMYRTGALNGSLNVPVTDGVNAIRVPIPSSCWNGHFALYGQLVQLPFTPGAAVHTIDDPPVSQVPADAAVTGQTASATAANQLWSFDICWFDAADTSLGCNTSNRFEMGLVPEGAASAQVILRAGGHVNYILVAV